MDLATWWCRNCTGELGMDGTILWMETYYGWNHTMDETILWIPLGGMKYSIEHLKVLLVFD